MAENGIKTTFLDRASAVDSVIGNKDGSTSLVPLTDFARQLSGLGVEGTDEWLLAQKFAENPEDDPVLEGQFSALHHSKKSEASSLNSQGAAATSTTQAVISEAKADISTAQAGVATTAAAAAKAAAEASGDVLFYDTKADATVALSGLSENQPVRVFSDESRGGQFAWYRVEGGALDYKPAGNTFGVYSTPSNLRSNGLGAQQWDAAETHWPPRTYHWVSDCELSETAAEDIILPAGHSGAGRWVYSPRWNTQNAVHSLPRLPQAQLDLAADGQYKVMTLGDSVTAKYTTGLLASSQNFTNWMQRQFMGKFDNLLESANTITTVGGALGSSVSLSDDEAVSLVGYYYNIAASAKIRLRSSGSDPFADSVRVYYIKEPGAGSLTVNLTAYTTGETTSITVDADGTRQSAFVDLTLAGGITGSIPNKRVYVDLEATGGAVKILQWCEAKDSSVPGKKLVYNRWTGRGGYTFDADVLAANSNVLAKQIVDFAPDLILVEYADPLNGGRLFIDALIEDLEGRDFYPDWLLCGTSEVYQPGVTDDLSANATLMNGTLVDNLRIHAGTLKAMSEVKANVNFHDHGAVIRSQFYGLETGVYQETDHIHPTDNGTAALIADLVRCIPSAFEAQGRAYLSQLVSREILLAPVNNLDLNSRTGVPRIAAGSSGDMEVEWMRNLNFKNYFSGTSETTARVDRFGVATKELRFTGSTSRMTSTVDGVISANNSRLQVGPAVGALDATQFQQVAKVATLAATAPTTGGSAGDLQYMTSPGRLFYCISTNNWIELVSTDSLQLLEKLSILIPAYADNAAAAGAGLAVNRLYRTASGEVRVRI